MARDSMIVAPTRSLTGTTQRKTSHLLKCSKACAMSSPINWNRRQWRMSSWMLWSRTHLNSAMSVRKRLRTKFVRFRKKRGTREVERVKRSLNSWFCSKQKKELPRRKESKNGKLNDERASDINNQPKHKLQINDNRNTRGPVGRTDNNHRTRSTAGRARERNGITTDRVCSWPLAVAEQLG